MTLRTVLHKSKLEAEAAQRANEKTRQEAQLGPQVDRTKKKATSSKIKTKTSANKQEHATKGRPKAKSTAGIPSWIKGACMEYVIRMMMAICIVHPEVIP